MATVEVASPAWPADSVERRPIAALVDNPRNSRTHSDEQVDQIVAAIREWGWTTPILVDEEGVILAGHGRVMAARKMGLDDAPVVVARGWTEAQKRAYVVADNQIAANAGWDENILSIEFGALKALDFDVGLTGFTMEAIDSFLLGPQQPQGGAGGAPGAQAEEARKSLMQRFGLAPFSVLSARGGWWQDRKRAWLALGIESELGRGENAGDANAEPGGSKRPAADYGKTGARGDGAGRSIDTGRRNAAPGGGGGGAYKRGGKAVDAKYERKGEATQNVVAGNGWANGGPARRDPAFYAKKREWEAANGRKISTTEFREKHWDGRA